MKIKQTILALVIFLSIFCLFSNVNVGATSCGKDAAGQPLETSIIGCTPDTSKNGVESTAIWQVLLLGINILTGLIGIAAVGGVIYGSILYASAGGNPEGIKKGKEIITNVVIGLLAYAAMYSLLNFIIPGGIFNY